MRRRAVPLLAGWFTLLTGAGVLGGWFLQIPFLVKPSWSANAMSFNTALSFVFAGIACILAGKAASAAARPAAVLAALLPAATLFASLAGYDLSVARWLYLPNSANAHMAPFTSVGLAAAALVFLFAGKIGQGHLAVDAALSGAAVTPLILGLLPAVGARWGVFDPTPGGLHFAAMSAMTAFGLIALGAASLQMVLTRSGPAGRGASGLALPVAGMVAIAIVSWGLFDSMLAFLGRAEDRAAAIEKLAGIDDAASLLDLDVAHAELRREQAMPARLPPEEGAGAAAKIANDYGILTALAAGARLEAAVKNIRTDLDAQEALLRSGPAVPSPVNERIAGKIALVHRGVTESIRAVAQANPVSEPVLRWNLIASWLVAVGAIGISQIALSLELRKRLKAEAVLRASERELENRIAAATEELRAEAQENREILLRLSDSEIRFRSTFKQAAVGLAHVSPLGLFIRLNDKLCRIVGYSREDLVQTHLSEITHPDDVGSDSRQADALLRGEIATYSMEKRYFHRDGRLVWINLTVSLVRKPDGEPDYFIKVIEDITPRKSVEQRLQASERRFRWVVESCPVGIVETDARGNVAGANPAFFNLVGWTAEEFAAEGMNLPGITPDDWMEASNRNLLQCLESRRAVVYEKEYFKRDGSRIPVLIGLSFNVEPAGNGEPAGEAVAFVLDMSELKRNEQLLRAGEHRFRQVVEAAPSAMIMAAADGRIRLVNVQAEKLFGYSREELIGNSIDMLIPERYRGGHAGHRASFLAAPGARAMGAGRDLFGLRRDGAEVPIEIGLNPVTTLEGEHVLAAVVDITERKAAEAALRASARQLALLADAMPQIVWTCHPDGSPEYYNRRWYEFTGFPEGASNFTMQHVVHPDDLESMSERWRAAVDSGLPYETQLRYRDERRQTWRWHLSRALPIRETDGKLAKWVGTSTDIDDYKKLSEELEQRVEQRTAALKRSLREKELLLKEVHHRVKNNLQIVCSILSMQVECAESGSNGAPAATLAEPILEARRRVQSMAMIHESLYQSETLADLDFGQYAESLATRLYRTYCVDTSPIRLELSVEPIRLTIDQAIPCGLILNELVSNALKHAFGGGRGGAIHVVFRHLAGRRVELSVADTGAGLPAGFDIAKVRSLGLQIVQALTETLGAELRIATGDGTTMALAWQLSDGEEPGAPDPVSATIAGST